MARTALRHQVAAGLRALREQAGVTREEAATVIRASVQTVGHIETARSLPNGLQLEKLLAHYGVPERIPHYLELRERARNSVDWWQGKAAAVPAYRALFFGGEATAERVEAWDPMQVPELARTPEYAAALLRATEPDLAAEEVERRVDLLVCRQREVLDGDVATVSLLFGEAALRWPVGTPEVMAAQAEYLVELAARPGFELWVLPLDAGRRGISLPFTVLSFPHLDGSGEETGAVYVETLVDGHYYGRGDQVDRYRAAFEGVRAAAIAVGDDPEFVRGAVGGG
ncbi:helix-turn-helix domain-containing protein [Actinophytocola gossypii]|uniref:Helix-turn-helix transcriptional regulator n=1 Tax=Actinophytocola gossypii TaxID=2812003 RepID=A0ABT2JJ29_9PSEU|nr:helix-turn-helix transcriptional regulator [Actinophytocola gossypii]MCT2587887.1 helix-turn-helix transcriptional regulator [Actinophytocola gossypii]